MKNLKSNISVSLIIIIIFLIIPSRADLSDHKPIICFDCHNDNGRFQYGDIKEDPCSCHKYVDVQNKILWQAMEEQHNPNTCNACHGVKESSVFHVLHVSTEGSGSCETCHGVNGQSKPDKSMNECGGCHGGQIHTIHQDNITGICVQCHGTRPALNPSAESSFSTNDLTAGIYAKMVNYRQYTLYELIKKLLGWS